MIFQDSPLMYTVSHSECFKKLPIKHKAEGLSGFALQGWPQYFVNFCFRSKSKIAIVEQSFRDILDQKFFPLVASLVRKPLEFVNSIKIYEQLHFFNILGVNLKNVYPLFTLEKSTFLWLVIIN